MKPLVLTSIITFSAASILLPSLHAEGLAQKLKATAESAVGIAQQALGEEKAPAGPEAGIDAALAKLKADIEKSMEAFNKSSMPDAEKVKKFDAMLVNFDKVLEQTAEGGVYEKSIGLAYDKNKGKLDAMRKKANDTSIPAEQRVKYEQQIPRFETEISGCQEKRLVMIRLSNDLKKRKEKIAQDKQFYLDMIEIEDLAAANKTLDQVNSSMDFLTSAIDKLGNTMPVGSEGPAKR